MEERGPITAHVEGLEAHIRGMYDELVSKNTPPRDDAFFQFGERSKIHAQHDLPTSSPSAARCTGKFCTT